jgi:hypothetical protein
MEASDSSRTKPLYRGTQVVWYIIGLLETLLAIRFVLKMLAANPTAGFSAFIYGITYPFAIPFLTVFRLSRVEENVFEWTTLLAMLVYWLIAWGIIKMLVMSKSVTTPQASAKLDQQE